MTGTCKHSKPDINTAMLGILGCIKSNLIDRVDYNQLCVADCYGCPKKIVEFVEALYLEWEQRLNKNSLKLGDIDKVSNIARRCYAALDRNGLIKG